METEIRYFVHKVAHVFRAEGTKTQIHFLSIYLFDIQFNFELPFHTRPKPPYTEGF
jgi:hypothetical protein